jgi:cytochrome c5
MANPADPADMRKSLAARARTTLRTHRPRRRALASLSVLALVGLGAVGFQATVAPSGPSATAATSGYQEDDDQVEDHAEDLVEQGRRTFRFDTFGDQDFWGGTLQLHKAIAGSANGGVGPGVSPKTALAVGLKVDVAALPVSIRDAIKAGQVDLDDPKITLALLKLNSVVGVKGFFASDGSLKSVGIECALCHSTVDDSFAPGIGKRLDGWANRDLNVGAIVSLSPNLQPVANLLHTDVPTVEKVLGAWGPGKFDAALFLDGKGFRPDGKTAATLIPPAFGLLGVNLHTYTGWGSVPYWNAFVANLEMHGKGTFYDKRLDNAKQFPIAAENRFGHTRAPVDLVSPKLPALHEYQLALAAPKPPKGSFDATAAARGKNLFMGKATCSTCHVPPTFTEPGHNLHRGSEIGIGNFQADRAPTHMYRTTPLKGLWSHQKGGFYHDGRYPDLAAVVRHYNNTFKLGLTAAQQQDLVQYLKSL